MYTRFSHRLFGIYVALGCFRGNRYVSTLSWNQRFLEITCNRRSAGNLTRTLYSLNILYQETDSTVLCKNKLAGEMARNEVDYKQLKDDLKNPNVLIIDVREPSEIAQTGKMEEAIHIRLDDVEKYFRDMSAEQFQEKVKRPKPTIDTKIIVTCQAGRRSRCAQETLQTLGYNRVYNYAGGWLEWQKKEEIGEKRAN